MYTKRKFMYRANKQCKQKTQFCVLLKLTQKIKPFTNE